MRRACLMLAIFVLLFSAFSLDAFQDRPTFKAQSDLVVLHVSVRDRGGRYISGLEREAFTVIDAGKPQTIAMFAAEDVPATIGILIDNSNSMRPHREIVIGSAVEFLKHSLPRDEMFVMTFNETVRQAWGPSIAGQTNSGRFASAMSRAIVARGMTAIYDGIVAGLDRAASGTHTRQVLIVVSDGDDNASRAGLDEVIGKVRQSDAVIYTIALTDPLTREGNPGLMRRLARETGGESYQPRRLEQVAAAFDAIATDVRRAYTIAYEPTAAAWTDADAERRRQVRVYVRSKDGRALRVRTRDGYFEKAKDATP